MKFLNKKELNAATKETIVAQALLAQTYADDHAKTMFAIENTVNMFSAKNLTTTGKPKKFLWWAVLNIGSVWTLVETIIKLIKDLRAKYESNNV